MLGDLDNSKDYNRYTVRSSRAVRVHLTNRAYYIILRGFCRRRQVARRETHDGVHRRQVQYRYFHEHQKPSGTESRMMTRSRCSKSFVVCPWVRILTQHGRLRCRSKWGGWDSRERLASRQLRMPETYLTKMRLALCEHRSATRQTSSLPTNPIFGRLR